MAECRGRQEALFYEFSLERMCRRTHFLRLIDRFVELDAAAIGTGTVLTARSGGIGRSGATVSYCFGIRSGGGWARR